VTALVWLFAAAPVAHYVEDAKLMPKRSIIKTSKDSAVAGDGERCFCCTDDGSDDLHERDSILHYSD